MSDPRAQAEVLDMLARDQDNEAAMHGHLANMPSAHDQYRDQQREVVRLHNHKAEALRAGADALRKLSDQKQ